MTDLSQIIEDALDAEGGEQLYNEEDFCCGVAINTSGLADRLAATVTAHFLDREKVKAVLESVLSDGVRYGYRPRFSTSMMYTDGDQVWDMDDVTDRLIAALAGGQS